MIEGKAIEARAAAEKNIEPLLRVVKHALIELFMSGFFKGLEACEKSEEELAEMLRQEEEALANTEEPPVLKRKVRQDEFSVRVWNVFTELKITTLGDIVSRSRIDFLSHKGFGKTCLLEVERYVGSFGYKLKTR